MPCSRTAAPLAQCEPRLIGESNTGSWRTQTPSTTIALIEQPTEQWVQTVFFTSVLPGLALAWAFASPIMLSGSCEAKAAAPAARPEPLRNVRRSTVFAPSAAAARASGFTLSAGAADLRQRRHGGLFGLRWPVSPPRVPRDPVPAPLRARRLGAGARRVQRLLADDHGRDGTRAPEAGGHQEPAAICF